MTTVTERLPRYKRRPGAAPSFDVTERDEEIIRIVARHRFIRSDQIVRLLKAADPATSEQNVVRRLQRLFHGNFLGRVQIESDRGKPGSQPIIFILGNKGIDLLAAKYGFRRSSADWTTKARTAADLYVEHALEVTDFMVALALACRRRGHLQVMYFDEIMRELAPPDRAAQLPSRPAASRHPGCLRLVGLPPTRVPHRRLVVPRRRILRARVRGRRPQFR